MSKCSIIIPHFNGENILYRCLNSIYNHTKEKHEVIVVDNASSDNSISMVKQKFPKTKIISNKRNLGYAGACNIGAEKSDTNFLVFLNNDTEVSKNWLEPLLESLKDKSVSSVQPKIKNMLDKNFFDYAGASGGYIDIFGYPFCRGRIFNTIEKDKLQYESSEKIFWASGTAFATKKEIFIESGMFDLNFFAHMEEIDYHWRSQLMGYDVMINPKSVIYHEGGQTLSYDSSKKTYLNHRNNLIMFLSNHKMSMLFLLFIPRILLHITSTLVDFLSLKFNHSLAQIAALLWVIVNPVYIFKKRFNNNEIKSDSYRLNGMVKKSIVFNYFILQKRYFIKE